MERAITYVDGFNLYFGLKSAGWQRYLWLNLEELSKQLLKPTQTLLATKYFTSRIASPPEKVKRQNTYIEALQTISGLRMFFGKYQLNPYVCRVCGATYNVPNEKQTDVNIAVELMRDAFEDQFDVALLISADSDLVGPIVAVRSLFPSKRIVVAFPPNRSSALLAKSANAHFQIGRALVARSLFPEQVTSLKGFPLQRPPSWK